MNVQLSLLSLIISDEIHNTLADPRMNKNGQDILILLIRTYIYGTHRMKENQNIVLIWKMLVVDKIPCHLKTIARINKKKNKLKKKLNRNRNEKNDEW